MNWNELINKPVDCLTPAEYAEAIRRMLLFLMNNWDGLEDGDGETVNLDKIATKTDLFLLIVGCCYSACDCIKDFNKLIKGVKNG